MRIVINGETVTGTVIYVRDKRILEYKKLLKRERDAKLYETPEHSITECLHSNPPFGIMTPDSIDNRTLNSTCIIILDLNKHIATPYNARKDLIKGRHSLIRQLPVRARQPQQFELFKSKFTHKPTAIALTVNPLIVKHNNSTVRRQAHVNLNGINAKSY